MNRIRRSFKEAWAVTKALGKDARGIVMVEWVALAGIFVVVLVTVFLLIGEKASVVVNAVDTQLGLITAKIGGGTGTGTGTGTATGTG